MAATDNELQLVIRAVDQASAILQRAREEVQQFAAGATQSLKQVEESSRSTETSFQAFMQVFGAQAALSSVRQGLESVVGAANSTQAALMGLATAAAASGISETAATAAAQSLAADGLMSVSDAALGLKNLLSTGYGLDQAVQIMDIFKDSASFGRQAALSFGESIVSATEGIKNQNEILLDNAGISTNATTLIKRNGGAMQDFSNITQDSTTRLRLLTGLEQEHAASAGNAARYSETFAGQQASLNATLTQTQARMGALVESGLSPLVSSVTQAIATHQQLVVALGIAGAAAIAFAALVIGLVGAVSLAVSIMGGPLTLALLAISAIIGGVLYEAIRKVEDQFGDMMKTFTSGTDGIKQSAGSNFAAASDSARKLAEQLKDISDNVMKANRDFQQSLADIVSQSQSKIADLKSQIADEQDSFTHSQDEKAASFQQSQQDQLDAHQQRVDDITKQLDLETAKGRFADAQRLSDLQTSLDRENADYARSTSQKQAHYNQEVADATAAHNKKLTSLQAELNQENAFLQKHASDVAGINASMALDQIDKLKQSHADQMAQYDKQKQRLLENAAQTTNGMVAAYNAVPSRIDTGAFKNIGSQIGHALVDSLIDEIKAIPERIASTVTSKSFLESPAFRSLTTGTTGGTAATIASGIGQLFHSLKVPGFASGVTDFQGGLAYVHEGEMLVNLPKGTDVVPRAQVQQAAATGGGVTIHQTNYNYSQYDLTAANRELGYQLAMGGR